MTRLVLGGRLRSHGLRRSVRRKGLLVALAVVAFVLGLRALEQTGAEPRFPIRYVRVEGEIQNLDVAKLQNAMLPAVSGGYFSVDIAEIEGVARSFAWVDQVQAQRVWPDTLVVTVTEHKPFARWGSHAFIDERGVRFTPEEVSTIAGLPAIEAPVGTEKQLLSMLIALDRKLESKGLSVASLDLSKRRAWIVRLNTGMEIHFGRQDPLAMMDRFMELVPKLGEDKLAQISRVDIRYPNGFAVTWKSAATIPIERTGV